MYGRMYRHFDRSADMEDTASAASGSDSVKKKDREMKIMMMNVLVALL